MQYKIISVGKVKNKSLQTEIEELKKRISRLKEIEIREIKDSNPEIIKKKEFEEIKKNLSSEDFKVLLTEKGESFSTQNFYERLKSIEKPICFIINGAFGHSKELEKYIDMKLSLSEMTFTHEQAKYLLFEQIYRLECFEKGIPYTK
ncbi:MAG: 23S rRNA (pseudouridine(1915)-N(3))-methyltransferase RlmH [Nanoarchaeota archaeon]